MLLNQRSQLSLKNKLKLIMKTLTNLLLITTVLVLFGCERKTVATEKLSENLIKVGIMVIECPKAVSANIDFKVRVNIKNTGGIVIPSLGKEGQLLQVGVTYHWRNFEEKIIVWDGLVTPLKSDIGLDQEQLVNMSIKSPEIPGRYILDIDLVQNSAFWFGAIGSQIARIMIDVV